MKIAEGTSTTAAVTTTTTTTSGASDNLKNANSSSTVGAVDYILIGLIALAGVVFIVLCVAGLVVVRKTRKYRGDGDTPTFNKTNSLPMTTLPVRKLQIVLSNFV